MGHPIVTTVTLNAGVANGYALSQSLGAAGALTLAGSLVVTGVGTPTSPRRVVIHSAGDDSAKTWTIVGTARTEQGGVAQTETLAGAGAGADAVSTQDFATVKSISLSAASAGAVTAGTNGTGSGPWVPWDTNVRTRFIVSYNGNVMSGAPTWNVDVTYDGVFGLWLPTGVSFPRAVIWAPSTGETGQADGYIDRNVRASRLTLTAFGSVQLTQIQEGD